MFRSPGAAAMVLLHAAGWSLRFAEWYAADGSIRWDATGTRDQCAIFAEGTSPGEAWLCLFERARSLGMIAPMGA